MSVKADLIAAKALIDKPDKWIKGWFHDKHGNFCAIGALNEATVGSPVIRVGDGTQRMYEARLALETALPRYWKSRGVADFNDSDRRKHADIMALFDRAIEAAA